AKLTHGSTEPLPKFGNSLIERRFSRPLIAECNLFSSLGDRRQLYFFKKLPGRSLLDLHYCG
ncbi:MAG: hypothetical protein ACREVN_02195, partial [Gammaproteobacteria bacterium]